MKLKRNISIKIKDKLILTFILIVLITHIILKQINKETSKILEPYLENDLKKHALNIINTSIIDNNKDIYSNLVTTNMNSEKEIIDVEFNSLKVNELLTNINKNIIDNLTKLENGSLDEYESLNNVYEIPFYIFSNNIFFRNLGFKMPFKIKISSNIKSNVKTELTSYGINNSLFKMYIEVNVNMRVIMPYLSKEINIITDVPVIMKIINGRIPEVYGGMYSINSHSV